MAAIAAWCNQKFARIESLRTRTFPRGSCFQPVYYFPKMVNLTNFYSKPSRFVHHRYPRPAALVTGTSTNTMASPQALLPMWLSAVILLAALHHAAPSVFVARRTLSRSSAGCKPGSPARSPSRPLLPTRRLTLKRTDALQHDLSMLPADTWGSTTERCCSRDSSWQPTSPPPKPSARRKLARTDRSQSIDLAPWALQAPPED